MRRKHTDEQKKIRDRLAKGIGKNISVVMEEKGWLGPTGRPDFVKLAKVAGLSEITAWRVINGWRLVTLEVAYKVAKGLDISIKRIMPMH